VHKLVNEFSKKGEMIPRSLNDLYEKMRDILVCEDGGEIKGVCALHILWEDLAEIRSLAVRNEAQRTGIGRRLVTACIKEAEKLGIKKVFALTYHPEFFRKIGFLDIDKSQLPQKIWADCLRCPKFPECDESAVILDLNEKAAKRAKRAAAIRPDAAAAAATSPPR
jgi:amino-acid N-acetyltransferase